MDNSYSKSPEKKVGKWTITHDLEVMYDGKLISSSRLDPIEHRILTYLLENPEQLITRDELGKAIWQEKWISKYDWILNQSIFRLRRKIGPKKVETVRGLGYIFHSS